MKEKLSNLINVKTIVTFIVVSVFAYLSVIGKVPIDQFMLVTMTIIGFYFGTQHEKKGN